jgi:hypothetical protein
MAAVCVGFEGFVMSERACNPCRQAGGGVFLGMAGGRGVFWRFCRKIGFLQGIDFIGEIKKPEKILVFLAKSG